MSDAVTGLLAYQYVALNRVTDRDISAYCRQLALQSAPGYQLYLLQLSCAERWLVQAASPDELSEAVSYHNRALMPLVRAAITGLDTRHLNLRLELQADTDEYGYDFESFYLSADLQAYDPYVRRHQDNGLGITMVGQRQNRGPQDRFFPPEGVFRALTVMPLKLDFSDPAQPLLTLRAVNMAVPANWQLAEKRLPLNYDPAAVYLCLVEVAVADQLETQGLFNAERVEEKLGIYAIEPLNRNKIPVLMIHGLNSSPLIWRRLSWAIFADPQLSARYQVWHAFYPSGPPPFFNAMRLRKRVDELLHMVMAEPDDIVANNMIVIGHSMGGIISKTFVQNTADTLWNTTFTKPPAELKVEAQTRQTLEDILIFQARPYVRAAVFIDTPHRGAATADGWLGWLASSMIRLPSVMKTVFGNMWLNLHGDEITPAMRRYMSRSGPNSVDVLSPGHPLLQQLNQLPFSVPVYSVIGNDRLTPCPTPLQCPALTDSVVPYNSAHLPQADAELMVQSRHNSYQSPEAISFILQILSSHGQQTAFDPQ
ncbi:alpha/beta fold hydrolase [Chromatiaceae bacterium AAb-1]|nr:alpha/beta fold hydrolase [Chromatiaceae bacterium AAb-1]